MTNDPLPYGVGDLKRTFDDQSLRPGRVRCFIKGCRHVLRPPTRQFAGDLCPEHGIRSHVSGTYTYGDEGRNFIVAADLCREKVVGHPFKYESNRLGAENSEDALSWNVFRSLQEAGQLHEVAQWITGLDYREEPLLFLWGICLTADRLVPWDLLIEGRKRFESNLPVKRPQTEPDIALFLPGRYLVLIEAKFTSPNEFYTDGPRKNPQSLTRKELLDIYDDPELQILDHSTARASEQIYYQLWRNTVFAEWMALLDDKTTRAFHANLTRAGKEIESCRSFRRLVRPELADRFAHITWEDIYFRCDTSRPAALRLRKYLETKTASLRPAFRLRTRTPESEAG